MSLDMEYLLKHARTVVKGFPLKLLLEDDPKYHAPMWHVHGVLGHAYNVWHAAQRFKEICGQDVTAMAVMHDICKFEGFPEAVAIVAKGGIPDIAYVGHEGASGHFAAEHSFLPAADITSMSIHHHAYLGSRPYDIVQALGSEKEAVLRWILLCACDAAGKGFTPAQIAQRPAIADKFRNTARLVGIDANDDALIAACAAVTTWDALPREQIPSFK